MKTVMHRFVLDTAGLLVFITLITSVLGLSAYFLQKQKTIVGQFYADHIVRTESTIEARIIGEKNLGCEYVLGSEQGFGRVEGYWTPIRFEYLGRSKGNRTIGHQDFGIWRWEANDIRGVTQVATVITHKCNLNGAEQLRSSVVGPFELPITEKE